MWVNIPCMDPDGNIYFNCPMEYLWLHKFHDEVKHFLLTQPWKSFGHHVFLQYTYPGPLKVYFRRGDAPPTSKIEVPYICCILLLPQHHQKRTANEQLAKEEVTEERTPKQDLSQDKKRHMPSLMWDEHTSGQFITTNPPRSPQMVV